MKQVKSHRFTFSSNIVTTKSVYIARTSLASEAQGACALSPKMFFKEKLPFLTDGLFNTFLLFFHGDICNECFFSKDNFNPFVPNAPFLYPLKIENFTVI